MSPQAVPRAHRLWPNVQPGTVLAGPLRGADLRLTAALARPLALQVGAQDAPHFPGHRPPQGQGSGAAQPLRGEAHGLSLHSLSGHGGPGARGSRAGGHGPAPNRPGIRASASTSEKAVGGRRQRVGEGRRALRGAGLGGASDLRSAPRSSKAPAPDTRPPISGRRGAAPPGGRPPPPLPRRDARGAARPPLPRDYEPLHAPLRPRGACREL